MSVAAAAGLAACNMVPAEEWDSAPSMAAAPPAPVIVQSQNTAPTLYTVQRGDSLIGIARAHGTSVEQLARLNDLSEPYRIYADQELIIRPGSQAAPMTMAAAPAPQPQGAVTRETLPDAAGAAPVTVAQAAPGAIAPPAPGTPVIPPPPQAPPPPPSRSVAMAAPPQPAATVRPATPPVTAGAAVTPPVTPAIQEEPTTPIEPATEAPPPNAPAPAIETASAAPPPAPAAAPAPAPATRFRWPLQGPVLSGYGPQGDNQRNEGINIGAPQGTPVVAAADGVVAYSGNELRGYGNLLLIRHEGGWVTAYAHLDQLLVERGARVTAGQTIGTVGHSGSVTEPQLHFEIRQGSQAVDPTTQLPRS